MSSELTPTEVENDCMLLDHILIHIVILVYNSKDEIFTEKQQ